MEHRSEGGMEGADISLIFRSRFLKMKMANVLEKMSQELARW